MVSLRALNRATLVRQLLLQRSPMSALDAIEHLVGMQAQAPFAPYYGLWSRLDGFTGDELSGLLTSREAVRIVLMRGTIHLVTAEDCHRLRPLVQPTLGRMLRTNATHGKPLSAVDVTAVVDAAKRLLDTEALTPGEIGAQLAEQWPDTPRGALAEAARSLLPLVQVPPRALWQRSGQVRLITATAWLGKRRGKPMTIDELVVRYLAAFGPAGVADAQTWSGLTRLGEVLERLDLMRFKSERGQTLYDIPNTQRPDQDIPAPVRLVAPFDNILLSHADRTRVISDEHRKRLFSGKNGVFPGTVLVDGFVAGTWELVGRGEATGMRVCPYVALSNNTVEGVVLEANRLLQSAFGVTNPEVAIAA
ncbi:MAG TPA: winged helix DNA-binding domain-containing protein [Mycobacterium sp.]|nr:winged helix DNA-binding domain-containing protein [Mycobacterium sp.]